MEELTGAVIRKMLKTRAPDSHKGNHGHALLIAGSKGSMGAALIAARACLRSGAGLLTVSAPENERGILQTGIPEAMVAMRENGMPDLNRFSAVGIGPGLGVDAHAKDLLDALLEQYQGPLLLDADALNIVAADGGLLNKLAPGTILTPHPKEFDRMFGHHQTEDQRINTASQKSKQNNVVVVLKGQHTKIIYGDSIAVNTTGNAGLAKGGSGDALTGIITALLAQGYTSFDAAQCGVFLHGLAADIALQKQSVESLLITDVIASLGLAFNSIRSEI